MHTDFRANREPTQHGRWTTVVIKAFQRIQQGLDWWEAHRQWPANEPATISEKVAGHRHSSVTFTARHRDGTGLSAPPCKSCA